MKFMFFEYHNDSTESMARRVNERKSSKHTAESEGS